MISWILFGAIAGIIKLMDKDFEEIHEKALDASGFPTPPNPKLFSLAMSILFGYYALYVELKYQLTKIKL